MKIAPALLPAALSTAWALLAPASAVSQSFACERASTAQEKAICADPALRAADAKMGVAYQRLRASLSPAASAEVQQDQRAWLDFLRKECPAKPFNGRMRLEDCLLSEENERTDDLTSGLQQIEGLSFFRRLSLVTAPNAEQPANDEKNPGFGVARLTWPEIDKPTPAQASFNLAAKVAAFHMVSGGEGAMPGEISPEDVSGTSNSIAYTFVGVNSHFLVLRFSADSYGYGAAHPNEFSRSFVWSLDRKRAMVESDVFRSAVKWQAQLASLALPLVYKADREDGRRSLYAADEVKQGIASVVVEPANWIPTREGLGIEFPEYTVAPRAAGNYSITIPWSALSSMFTPGFDPTLLPARLKPTT